MIGRIRTVKPEIFSDEKLWDLSLETGLPLLQAFQGLWCYADREGRFEWRPRALKTLVLPYWEGDFALCLEALERGRYVVRYVVDGREYGMVRNFTKHQRVNQREAQSTIPSPPVIALHVQASGEGNGTELKGREGDARAVPEVPGLQIVGAGRTPGTHAMPGPDPTPSYLAACVMAGVKPEQARDTWVYYASKGLPPGDYPNLEGWLVLMAKQRQTGTTKAPKSGPRIVESDLDTTGAATAFRPSSDHEKFCAVHGLDLSHAVRLYRASPEHAKVGFVESERRFMTRLKCWLATGTFIADGPLPRPPAKLKEARA